MASKLGQGPDAALSSAIEDNHYNKTRSCAAGNLPLQDFDDLCRDLLLQFSVHANPTWHCVADQGHLWGQYLQQELVVMESSVEIK